MANVFTSDRLPANELQVFKGPGTLTGLSLYNNDAATAYALIFDSLDEPAESAIAAFPPIPLADAAYYESAFHRSCRLGCWIVISTDPATRTTPAGTDVYLCASVA